MPAPTLLSLCIKKCVTNIGSIEDVGSLEFFQIQPVLKHIKTAEQLRRIELASPQIQGDNAELWQKFIEKEIPTWKTKNYTPKNPTKWYQVYCKYHKEQKEEIQRDQDILRQTLLGIKNTRDAKMSRIEDAKNLPKVPRDPRMIANNGGVPLRGRVTPKHGSSLTWTAGSKTKMTDGKSVLNRARKEAREISAMSKLAKPTASLGGHVGQVARAPAAMATEYRIKSQPAIKILSRKRALPEFDVAPKLNNSTNSAGPSLEEREARLRQAMQSKQGVKRTADDKPKPNFVDSDGSLEDSELDDIFDIPPARPNRPMGAAPRIMKPMATSRLSPPKAAAKPSDVISTMLSRKPTNAPTIKREVQREVIRSQPSIKRETVKSEPSIKRESTFDIKSAMGARPLARPQQQSPATASPAPPRRDSPESKGQNRPPLPQPGMVRKRKEVDIFNRRPTKRQRPS